jgi:hypothetical protein
MERKVNALPWIERGTQRFPRLVVLIGPILPLTLFCHGIDQ